MDAREFAEWRAYYDLEPFGQDRQDAGAAIVAHTVAVVNGAKDTKVSDFLPRFDSQAERPKRASGEEMLARARAFAARFKALSGGRS